MDVSLAIGTSRTRTHGPTARAASWPRGDPTTSNALNSPRRYGSLGFSVSASHSIEAPARSNQFLGGRLAGVLAASIVRGTKSPFAPAEGRANPEPWRRRGGRAPQKRRGGERCDQPRHLLALANDARRGSKARLGPQQFSINRASVCNRKPSKSASPRLRAALHPAACHPTSITEPPEDQPKPQFSPRREPLSDLEGLAWSCSSVAEDDQPVPPALWPIRSHLVTLGN